jgi:hypothetical protein
MHPLEHYILPDKDNVINHYRRRRLLQNYVQEVTETWMGNQLVSYTITDRTHEIEVIEHFTTQKNSNRTKTLQAKVTVTETQRTHPNLALNPAPS